MPLCLPGKEWKKIDHMYMNYVFHIVPGDRFLIVRIIFGPEQRSTIHDWCSIYIYVKFLIKMIVLITCIKTACTENL